MLEKKYYDGMQIHDVICECIDDPDTIKAIMKKFASLPSADVHDKNVGDIISRRTATEFFLDKGMITAAIYVEGIPSAKPQRKKGRLLKDPKYGCICSECRNVIDTYHTVRFCTWCGADLLSDLILVEKNGGK